jgi:hypothetical protein
MRLELATGVAVAAGMEVAVGMGVSVLVGIFVAVGRAVTVGKGVAEGDAVTPGNPVAVAVSEAKAAAVAVGVSFAAAASARPPSAVGSLNAESAAVVATRLDRKTVVTAATARNRRKSIPAQPIISTLPSRECSTWLSIAGGVRERRGDRRSKASVPGCPQALARAV